MLKEKKKAPLGVVIQNQDGEDVSLNSMLGKWVILYFYPKDNTPGCTVEAQGFRDEMHKLKRAGATVIGVSKDTPTSHQKFIKGHDLNFTLWSDPEHVLMDAFGTWQKKKFMGREYMGTTRSTFLINPDGKIVKVWEEVTPLGHAEEVLIALKQLKKQ